MTNDEIRKSYVDIVKSKQLQGLVLMLTNEGPIRVLIHCDKVPKTAENFLELCESHFYDSVEFHRLIPGFMVQGGDPDGTGKGGKAYFDKEELSKEGTFKDEFNQRLTHEKRGVFAMANSGPNTNRSQFYITFAECSHLDNKHSVFGEIVPGSTESFATLDKIEKIGHGLDIQRNRPAKKIRIVETIVLENPFRDAIAQLLLKEWAKPRPATSVENDANGGNTWASMSTKNLQSTAKISMKPNFSEK